MLQDDDWEDEGVTVEGKKGGEYGFLSDVFDEGNGAFEDDEPAGPEYDDLTDFPVSTINMKVCGKLMPMAGADLLQTYLVDFFKTCQAQNVNDFGAIVDQLNVEEIVVMRQALSS
jgi:importin-9